MAAAAISVEDEFHVHQPNVGATVHEGGWKRRSQHSLAISQRQPCALTSHRGAAIVQSDFDCAAVIAAAAGVPQSEFRLRLLPSPLEHVFDRRHARNRCHFQRDRRPRTAESR